MKRRLSRRIKNRGNLNRHARDLHMGKTVFLHLHSGLLILTNYPKIIAYGHVYKDMYGQLPNPKNFEWQNYQLNFKLYNRI
jgi:hypothetical protein